MKIIVSFLFVLIVSFSFGQIKKVDLQASGLTCSMCSNAINKALKTLDYVAAIDANIEHSTFEITFKPNAAVNFDELKKKVEGAGFFVAKMTFTLMVDQLDLFDDKHLDLNGVMFHFLNVGNHKITGENTFQILDKGYVTAKEFKKNSKYTTMPCYQTGLMGVCCKNKVKSVGTRIYHVTI
jgi:copper chaperone CopZ